jgi:hypothetical protein
MDDEETMSGITLEQAQKNLDSLLSATSLSVRMADRSIVSYASQDDRNKAIEYWRVIVAQLTNVGAPRASFGFSLADFRNQRLREPGE